MFYPLEKNSKKPSGGGIHPHPPPPPLYVRGLPWGLNLVNESRLLNFRPIFFFNGDGPFTP